MNESLKKLSTEIAAEIAAIIKAAPTQDFIAKTKAASDDDAGTFEVVVSTADVDRQGEVVDQAGWDLSNYKNNPVVLFGHDYYSLPIGVCDSIELIEGKLVAKGRFAPMEANPFAQQVRRLYDLKIMRATSVGFIVREANGNIITKAELLEFSFVPVPANPYALSMRQVQELGLDLSMINAKGLDLKVKEEDTTPPADPQPEATPEPEKKPEEETPAPEPTPEPNPEPTPEPETPTEDPEKKPEETPEPEATPEQISEEVEKAIGALAEKYGSENVAKVVGDAIVKTLKTNISVGSKDTEGGEGEEQPSAAPSQRSNLEILSASKELQLWLDQRAVLRAIATATTSSLEALNDSIRKERGY